MKKMKFYILVLFAILSMADFALAQATLSVQGTVQKSTGTAVDDGDYSLTFKLYTTETGGTAVWSETQDPVNIIGGVYSVTLGTVTPLTAAFDQTYYLGISVGTGTELIPRARLTSSPYALSLIGQGNIFPSTGAVGAGTVTPIAGYQLHVKADTGDGKLLVEGENNAKIDLKQGVNTVGITYDGSAIAVPGTVNMPGTVNVGTLNATNFSYNPANMAITSKLAVGQGSVDANNTFRVTGHSFFSGFVEINGSKTYNTSPGGFFGTNGPGGTSIESRQFSLQANFSLNAAAYFAFSDRRIKKDFRLSEHLADLAILRKLRVTDYRHINNVENGSDWKKGFVAQEVKETYPEAVTLSSNFIPNVYALSNKTQLATGNLTILLDKNHDFQVGDEVKIIIPTGEEKKVFVKAIPSENTFVIEWSDAAPDKIFVYGKKVSDFHTVDYDRIFTLNVSATQELARRVEQLEAENATLRQRNDGLQQQNDGLRGDVNDIYKRLQDLEKRSHLEK
jgi:Chaperone of endosialidase